MLKFGDLSRLFATNSGINDDCIQFGSVSCYSKELQPKGLFIPAFLDSGTLQEAISNGAIAAVWTEKEPIPEYTPNHFPIFYTDDLMRGLKMIMKTYENNLTKKKDKNNGTKFIFQDKELLNEKDESYDIAVMAEKLNKFSATQFKAGEE